MQLFIIPIGLILWYLAYEAKPIINEDITNLLEEENIVKRNRLLSIINEGV